MIRSPKYVSGYSFSHAIVYAIAPTKKAMTMRMKRMSSICSLR
ncbi:MAG TPA: hypothetical protein VHI13_22345 [Candidatus Kapabacteria bacterium]|nr:hypothetical protein [Candidatus Kapabacteria bacterium]